MRDSKTAARSLRAIKTGVWSDRCYTIKSRAFVACLRRGPLKDLPIGDFVFYPTHGVAKVMRKEDMNFDQEPQEFYVLELQKGGSLFIPTAGVNGLGLRPLVSPAKAKKLLKKVVTVPATDAKVAQMNTKDRTAKYAEDLKTGESELYTEVLQELRHRAIEDKLTTSERHLFDKARHYFVTELSTVLDRPPKEIEDEVAIPPSG